MQRHRPKGVAGGEDSEALPSLLSTMPGRIEPRSVLTTRPFPSLSVSDNEGKRLPNRVIPRRVGQAEQGGGDDGRENDAAGAHEEGGVVAGVEDGQVGPRPGAPRRVGSRDGGERREA